MSVLVLADVKAFLNIAAATTTYDVELQEVIDRAEAAIAKRCGPLSAVETTERVSGGGHGLVVTVTPIAELTSVTPVGGTAYDITEMTVHASSGVIEWTATGSRFAQGRYDVVYDAGRASVPDDLLAACMELVRHMWSTQRGPSRRPGSTTSESTANTVPGAAYIFPFRVTELMAPHVQVGN